MADNVKKMSAAQMKYAMSRIDSIYGSKSRALTTAHTTPAKSITREERADLVRSGKVKLKANVTRIERYDDVVQVFDFSKYEGGVEDTAKLVAAQDALRAETERVRDQVMLGDTDEALKLIEAFSS